eukprot:gnl/TRDRNA2_/TRDRNA2_141858_c1_seq1.p1 gnl/TRDRNA2_/TRDRNA2_141858_c1~~gnl/TRDRNA2_/TRDRNA2_141858_c1_seq1.p1  ORF type:complete len:557 (+),score=88.24 gnl/TRDRNA2_/TRDRNA2_141858_c1_seq1:173-1672(+)
MRSVAAGPVLQSDPLLQWELTQEEQQSGQLVWEQFWDASFRLHWAPLTGMLAMLLMAAMIVTSLPCVRRGTNCCSRRLGGYNLFSRVHRLWKWVYVLLLLHAGMRFWIWLFFPALLLLVDRMLLAHRQRPYAALKHVRLLPRDVIGLTFEVPQGFTYEAGQYVHLGWKGEWHPFTLTSAPEERHLSVHIRAPDTLDWCSALRRRLTVEAPAAFGLPPEPARPGLVVEYKKCTHPRSHTVYCRPARSLEASEPHPFAEAEEVHVELEVEVESSESLVARQEQLPKDAVVLQLTGPFGAPAQKVWQFETIMVVGAGIGVTPFVSILRSVQLRAHQRQAILASAGDTTLRRRGGGAGGRQEDGGMGAEGLEQLLKDVITVPKRIYFYWIVRGQEEFDWFYDLLAAAVEGPAREIININVFMTGEIELSQVKELTCVNSQFFGRPNWGRIFKENRSQHKGEHIGVFLCGSPAIGRELSRQSAKHTDPPDCPGGTRFSFFKEHF